VLAVAAMAVLLGACAGGGKQVNPTEVYHAYDRPARLSQEPGKVRVKVSLSQQRVYVLEGSEMLLVMPVSVGTPAEPTPRGDFRILRKSERKRATAHGYAYKGDEVRRVKVGNKPGGWSFKGTPLPYWCEFQPGYGFHTGWVRHHPCTDGSIRMHENVAPKFYRLVKVGTPVHIAYAQPEDATHGRIPLPPDAGPLPDYPLRMYVGDGYFKQHKEPEFD
jgi:hypothetical protein